MNAKVERINDEIKRVKVKINDYQNRLKDLEKQKIDAENAEIVMLVRGIDIAPGDLRKALEILQKQTNNAPSVNDGRKEENDNAE